MCIKKNEAQEKTLQEDGEENSYIRRKVILFFCVICVVISTYLGIFIGTIYHRK